MKERPILFSSPMVRALLAGTKTQTRRIAKEFEARDIGAPYERRRVFLISSPSLSRLALAWSEGPRAIERVARAADARGAWDPDQLDALPVDARSAGEHDRGPRSRERRELIEALGDSNPPGMAEVIGHCLRAGSLQEAA